MLQKLSHVLVKRTWIKPHSWSTNEENTMKQYIKSTGMKHVVSIKYNMITRRIYNRVNLHWKDYIHLHTRSLKIDVHGLLHA